VREEGPSLVVRLLVPGYAALSAEWLDDSGDFKAGEGKISGVSVLRSSLGECVHPWAVQG